MGGLANEIRTEDDSSSSDGSDSIDKTMQSPKIELPSNKTNVDHFKQSFGPPSNKKNTSKLKDDPRVLFGEKLLKADWRWMRERSNDNWNHGD